MQIRKLQLQLIYVSGKLTSFQKLVGVNITVLIIVITQISEAFSEK